MREVTKYEARDGLLFDAEADALAHEAVLDLAAELDDSIICWHDTSAREVAEWFAERYDLKKKEPRSRKRGG